MNRRRRLSGIIAALALGLASGASAGERPLPTNFFSADGADPRRYDEHPTPRAGTSFVGHTLTHGTTRYLTKQLDVGEGRADGTGFMVSPCLMLTNFHAVFGTVDVFPDRREKHFVYFNIGREPDGADEYTTTGIALDWGDFAADRNQDFVIVLLNQCVGLDPDIGYASFARRDVKPSAFRHGALAGFPSDRAHDVISVQYDCAIFSDISPELLVKHYCWTAEGSSGAPLFIMVGGEAKVVGIHFASGRDDKIIHRPPDPEKANWAVSIDWIRHHTKLDAWIADDIRNPGHPLGDK